MVLDGLRELRQPLYGIPILAEKEQTAKCFGRWWMSMPDAVIQGKLCSMSLPVMRRIGYSNMPA
jgi:hypothetical protein